MTCTGKGTRTGSVDVPAEAVERVVADFTPTLKAPIRSKPTPSTSSAEVETDEKKGDAVSFDIKQKIASATIGGGVGKFDLSGFDYGSGTAGHAGMLSLRVAMGVSLLRLGAGIDMGIKVAGSSYSAFLIDAGIGINIPLGILHPYAMVRGGFSGVTAGSSTSSSSSSTDTKGSFGFAWGLDLLVSENFVLQFEGLASPPIPNTANAFPRLGAVIRIGIVSS